MPVWSGEPVGTGEERSPDWWRSAAAIKKFNGLVGMAPPEVDCCSNSGGNDGTVGIGYWPKRVFPGVWDWLGTIAPPMKVVFIDFCWGFCPVGDEAKTGGGVGAVGSVGSWGVAGVKAFPP